MYASGRFFVLEPYRVTEPSGVCGKEQIYSIYGQAKNGSVTSFRDHMCVVIKIGIGTCSVYRQSHLADAEQTK